MAHKQSKRKIQRRALSAHGSTKIPFVRPGLKLGRNDDNQPFGHQLSLSTNKVAPPSPFHAFMPITHGKKRRLPSLRSLS